MGAELFSRPRLTEDITILRTMEGYNGNCQAIVCEECAGRGGDEIGEQHNSEDLGGKAADLLAP